MAQAAVPAPAGYTFQAEPRAVTRAKYRDPNAAAMTAQLAATVRANIMTDRRIVRGNTYAAQIPTLAQRKMLETKAEALQRRAQRARDTKGSTQQLSDGPDSLSGQAHAVVQTDEYLEELVDQVFEEDNATQTDHVEERPELPVFRPRDIGVDRSTWIEPGELFDFDLAVEPILEVVVGKCLDQGLTEVLEEQELQLLKFQRERFEAERNAAIAETQRLEAECQRRFEEKERRLAQARVRAKAERAVATKAAAASVAKQYLSSLNTTVVKQLESEGVFYDPMVQQIEYTFMPWLVDQVQHKLSSIESAQSAVDGLLVSAVQHLRAAVAEKQRQDQLAREEAERRRRHEEEQRRILEEQRRIEAEQRAAAAAAAVAAQADADAAGDAPAAEGDE